MKINLITFILAVALSLGSFKSWAEETPQEVGTFESTVDEALHSHEMQLRPITYTFAAQTSLGSFNAGTNNITNLPQGSDNVAHFATFTPQLALNFKSAPITSAYIAVPLYWDTSEDSSSSRTFGRPELGLSKLLFENTDLVVEIGLAAKLPLYEDSSGYYPDGNRVYQFAPSLATDQRLGHSRLHFTTASRMSYDTKASVALPLSTSGDVKSTGLERPLTLRVAAGLEFDERVFSLGLGLKSVSWLGSGKVTDGNAVAREVNPVDVLVAEFTSSYQIRSETRVNFSVTGGLKTRTDFYALVQEDAPDEIASSTLSVGVTQNF